MRWTRAAAWTLAIAIALAWIASCERGRAPGTAAGRARVVALSPAVAVMLRDLGLADRVVGRHMHDMVLPEGVPIVGDQGSVDLEALVRLAPTHIILEWGVRPLPAQLVELAAARGWDLVNVQMLTLDEVDASARRLWAMLGDGDDRTLERVLVRPALERLRRDRAGAGRVLLLMSTDPPAAIGPGSAHHELLVAIGATPAIDEGRPYMPLDAEDLMRLAPDVIVVLRPRPARATREVGGESEPEPSLGIVGRLDTPARRAGRIVVLDDPLALVNSTNLAALAGSLDELLR